jgi:hypothetical protein
MATSAERLKQYEDLFEKSQAYDPAKFQQDFERAYGEATNYNQDLINQQSQALGNLQTVAPELRQKYSQTLIKDPTLQRSLIAQARQAPITDYSNAVNLLGQRGQRYADILQSSLGGYQTAAERAQTAAENAWRMYQDQRAQEEAARARAAAAASQGPSLMDIIAGLQGGQEPVQDELDITVEDTPQRKTWTERLTPQAAKEAPSTPGFMDYLKMGPLYTGSTLVGNLLGNRKQDNMSFLDKLFNRR